MSIQSRITRGIGFGALAIASLGYIAETVIATPADGRYKAPRQAKQFRKVAPPSYVQYIQSEVAGREQIENTAKDGVQLSSSIPARTHLDGLPGYLERLAEQSGRVALAGRQADEAQAIADAYSDQFKQKQDRLRLEEEIAISLLLMS